MQIRLTSEKTCGMCLECFKQKQAETRGRFRPRASAGPPENTMWFVGTLPESLPDAVGGKKKKKQPGQHMAQPRSQQRKLRHAGADPGRAGAGPGSRQAAASGLHLPPHAPPTTYPQGGCRVQGYLQSLRSAGRGWEAEMAVPVPATNILVT